jgi:hypothetical protein
MHRLLNSPLPLINERGETTDMAARTSARMHGARARLGHARSVHARRVHALHAQCHGFFPVPRCHLPLFHLQQLFQLELFASHPLLTPSRMMFTIKMVSFLSKDLISMILLYIFLSFNSTSHPVCENGRVINC